MVTDTAVPPTDTENLARQLKLLANSKRLQILNLLMEGVQCNCGVRRRAQHAPQSDLAPHGPVTESRTGERGNG